MSVSSQIDIYQDIKAKTHLENLQPCHDPHKRAINCYVAC